MNKQRLQQWFNGELKDEDLTAKEVKKLEKLVFKAVAKKVLERPSVFTFGQHPTVQ
jgi:hypothetical protein